MRSAVLVLMFAVCLVAMKCNASTVDDNTQQDRVNEQPASSPTTTTAAQQPLQTDQEGPPTDHAPLQNPADPIVPENTPPKPLQTAHQSPPQHTSTGQQQPQPQISPSSTGQDELQRQRESGVGLPKREDAAPGSAPEQLTQPEQIGNQEQHTDSHTNNQDPDMPSQTHAAPPSKSSHSTGTGVQHTPQRQPTTTINTDNTLDEGTDSATTLTEKTPKDHNDAQVSPPTSQDNKPFLQDTSNSPNKTTDKNPVSAAKRETLTPAATENARTQTNTTTEIKATHAAQKSVTSTAEPAKKESTSSGNPAQKMSKTMHPLDKKDSSIGSSSLVAFPTLVTIILTAVVPEF